VVVAAATGLQLAVICAAMAAHESEAMRANRAVEANLASGMNHLSWLGKQASAMEAARAEANREAGS
jgi:hypothetical protein